MSDPKLILTVVPGCPCNVYSKFYDGIGNGVKVFLDNVEIKNCVFVNQYKNMILVCRLHPSKQFFTTTPRAGKVDLRCDENPSAIQKLANLQSKLFEGDQAKLLEYADSIQQQIEEEDAY